MTPVNFAKLVRLYTHTNSTTLPDADILIYANTFKDDIAALIGKEVGEDYFGLRYKRDLIVDRREYNLPDEILGRIKYIEAQLDGTNWEKLSEIDWTTYGEETNEDTIRLEFSERDPAFEMWDRSVFILSGDAIIAVTEGLKLWAIIYPADLANLTDTDDMSIDPDTYSHGFPRQFHELLARRISIAYKSSKDRPISLSGREKLYDKDLEKAIENMKDANLDRTIIPSVPYDDGSSY